MSWYWALALAGLSLLLMWIFDRAARLRRSDGDSGDYWTAVVRRLSIWLLPPLLLSSLLQAIHRPFWSAGYHLHFDLAPPAGWSRGFGFLTALALPFAFWTALLCLGLLEKPRGRPAGRWLAGSIGYGASRKWLLLFCTLPLAALLAATFGDLNAGAVGYPAANWAAATVLVASLIGIYFSYGDASANAITRAGVAMESVGDLPPWPEAMRAGGIELERIAGFPAGAPLRPARGASSRRLAQRLENAGARDLAPELVEAIDALLHPAATGDDLGPTRLVLASDECGQTELVAMAAATVDRRFHAITLVIVSRGAKELCARLARWLPRPMRALMLTSEVDADDRAVIWVVDAETLSHHLLPLFKGRKSIDRVGFVVWWGLESYTGVLGANLWAISRRLHRLFLLSGRADVRTLALARRPAHADAQMSDFVSRLLPHTFPRETVVHVDPRFTRQVELYRLISQRRLLAEASSGRPATAVAPHPMLGATRVSADSGWPTLAELAPEIIDSETETMIQLTSGGTTVGDRLVAGGPPEASARLLHVAGGELLSLIDLLAQSGRNSSTAPSHVAIMLDSNPYLAYLLGKIAQGDASRTINTARRLVCAEAHRDVLRYHLLLALNEHSATRQELLRNFRLDERVIAETLQEIAANGDLSQKEVRMLDARQQLVIDQHYESRRLPESGERPLDVVGTRLVRVLDRAAGHQNDGVRMVLDPERLTIQAYPHRRFLYRGRRYRVSPWPPAEEIAHRRELDCEQDAVLSWTWRIRNLMVLGLEPTGASFSVGRRGRLLTCVPVALHYEEEVTGAIRVVGDAAGSSAQPEILKLPREISTDFATRGLALCFPDQADGMALRSLAQALRHVLPVHLGVEEDAIEVVPMRGVKLERDEVFGLAIVDLYPRGIGLVDAIKNDADFLLKLLTHTKSWLSSAADDCLQTPAALAANYGEWPRRQAALGLLDQVL